MRISLTAVAALALLTACHKDAGDDTTEQPSVGANTTTVTKQPFTEVVGAIGSVSARAGHAASLSAPAPARVAGVLVTTGQTVAAGQPLISLEQAPFEAAAQSAQTALDAAQRAYERQERLANEGIVPRKDAEAAAAELARVRSEAAAARRAAELSTLRAPINGVVTRLAATMGASVDPSQVLIEIADPSAVDVLFNVTPGDAGRIHPGARVSLSAGQDATGESLGMGAVVDVASIVDSATRTVAVRVQAPTTRRPMRIGETVFGQIAVNVRQGAIVVPLEALVPEGDGFKVFVVDPTGIAHERDVKVGGRTDKLAEIVEGLSGGERVATQGAYGLEDSVRVVPLKPDTTDGGKPERS
jgi:cobalt-zinc-cadmium efflux system membrane fusion protein